MRVSDLIKRLFEMLRTDIIRPRTAAAQADPQRHTSASPARGYGVTTLRGDDATAHPHHRLRTQRRSDCARREPAAPVNY